MSRADSGTSVRRARPTPNVYSVLVVIATLMLALGAVFMFTKNVEQTQGDFADSQGQGSNPFYIIGQDG